MANLPFPPVLACSWRRLRMDSTSLNGVPQVDTPRGGSFGGAPENGQWAANDNDPLNAHIGGGVEVVDGENWEPECWICRDTSSAEPLVQPCRCRGSMTGVHASCVETWVQCSGRSAGREPPHCPVCRQRYGGSKQKPGPQILARHLAGGFFHQLAFIATEAMRFVLLGTLLVQYSEVAEDGNDSSGTEGPLRGGASHMPILPAGRRSEESPMLLGPSAQTCGKMLLAIIMTVFLFHKLAVLMVSLPPQRARPARRFAQHFFTTDLWVIARHVAELLAAVVLLGARCVYGDLPFRYFLPVGIVLGVILLQVLIQYPVSVCIKEAAVFLVFVICTPVLATLGVARLLREHRRRLINPLDGPVHVIVALVAMVLCLVCQSKRPVMTLFMAHSSVLALGLFEKLAVRHLIWRDGDAWWCALLIAVEAASIALDRRWFTLLPLLIALRSLQNVAAHPLPQALFQGPLWWCALLVFGEAASLGLREVRGAPARTLPTEIAACIWLALLFGIACLVNWRRCVRQYHRWQRRHATFVLCTSRAGTNGSQTRGRNVPSRGNVEDFIDAV